MGKQASAPNSAGLPVVVRGERLLGVGWDACIVLASECGPVFRVTAHQRLFKGGSCGSPEPIGAMRGGRRRVARFRGRPGATNFDRGAMRLRLCGRAQAGGLSRRPADRSRCLWSAGAASDCANPVGVALADSRVGTVVRSDGVVEFPDGVHIRGRGLRGEAPLRAAPGLEPLPARQAPADTASPGRWVRWPDLWLPLSAEDARSAFEEAHRLAADGLRVELACGGGTGRTGTALACIAQIGGVPAKNALEWTRKHYNPRAIETPWQRRYVRRFNRSGGARF